ncbi:transcriptional Coactivator p15-domain-containing protein [Xylariomycetidae sp. FL2044]|nr:transcriptional Coactivator p15-domain-containing protein [Xylariomycetidae sp. FL2044]
MGPKNLKRSRRVEEDHEASSDGEVMKSTKPSKKTKTESTESGKDAEGNSWWNLGGTRRVTVSDFKGKTYINIREYYTDTSGELKPGKKGIMLTPDHYNKLLGCLAAVNSELQSKGIETADIATDVPAPESPKPSAKSGAKKDKKGKKKANIEATSDEEEGVETD